VADAWNIQELIGAGWSEADLSWEQATERVAEAAARRDNALAKEEAGAALRLARGSFERIDPRLGTSLANFGLSLQASGDRTGNAALFREATEVWRGAEPWIARMDAPRVARSSLFHMRMEQRHRETYRARWRERWQEIAGDARARLTAVGTSSVDLDAVAVAQLARWRRERPAMLNDTRKLMAAAYLLLASPT
jgi:hypothetical protein